MNAQQETIQKKSAGERLAALLILLNRKERLETRHKAAKAEWRERFTVDTKAFKERIRTANPAKSGDRLQKLIDIEQALDQREEDEKKKKAELDKIDKQIKSVWMTMVEVIRMERDDEEGQLAFDGEAAQVLQWTADGAKVIHEALVDHRKEGGELGADMEALEEELKRMGLAHIQLVDTEGEDEAEPPAAEE